MNIVAHKWRIYLFTQNIYKGTNPGEKKFLYNIGAISEVAIVAGPEKPRR